MVYKDKKTELDNITSLVEYLASFWNPEAVKKIQEIRQNASQHKFKSDNEFEEEVISGDYKNNPLLQAIQKIRENEKSLQQNYNTSKRGLRSKLPTDLSVIQSTLEKFR